MRRVTIFLSFLLATICTFAADPVQWSMKIADENTKTPQLIISANIAPGFHLYAMDNPDGGVPLSINLDLKGCKSIGKIIPDKKYTVAYNDIFMSDEHYYSGNVTFTQKLNPTASNYEVHVEIQGQACDENSCVQTFESRTLTGKSTNKITEISKLTDNNPTDNQETTEVTDETEIIDSLQSADEPLMPGENLSDVDADNLWRNVQDEMKVFEANPAQQSRNLWFIFIAGFIGGLIALVTPCVWPMIPMTVSFFLKKNKSRANAIGQAAIYGASIIVIYVLLGLVVTVIFGASALNELATSAGFNIAFFLLLVLFAISFMGGFELTLPSSWGNKVDSKVDSTTGYLSIFFMAFTLALVSFSCTGPIIGTLLVEAAATSNFISPAIGMFGFALALALPFTIFALFPTLLKSAPKSGGWMNTVKVVLGFLELALALKFLSVADLAYGWRILDREVFISLWIVIFALLGIYLLGKIRFPHDSKVEKIGVGRFMLACISLSFAVYMIPGLWGAPLKSISAFTPPIYTQDFNLYDGSVHAKTDNYEKGLQLSAESGKPVLLDFSGYGCVNCRKMEAAVWTNPEVKSIIDNDFILVSLMVDDKTPLPAPIKVQESNGKERTLWTIGDKWSYLERIKFGSNAQPYYVVVNSKGEPMSGSYGYKENVDAYIKFLKSALKNYRDTSEK